MEIKTLKCPNCNADITPVNGIDTFYCQHCGSHLMLDGRSDTVVFAEMRIAEMKHEKEMADRYVKAEARSRLISDIFKFLATENGGTVIIVIALIILFALPIGNFSAFSSKSSKEEKRLQKIVENVNKEIAANKYDEARKDAEQIIYLLDSEDSKKHWDDIKKELLETIDSSEKRYLESKSINVPMSSSSAKGKPYNEVRSQFTDAGFTNVTTVESDSKAGFFDKAGDVKSISIDGNKKFKSGELFLPDATIVIEYYKVTE